MSTPSQPQATAMFVRAQDQDVFRQIGEVIRTNLNQLRKPGVISARPGYKAVGGWLTRKPAVVVTVARKITGIPNELALPATLGGFALDVRQASATELLRANAAQSYLDLAMTGRREAVLPEFSGEVDVASGHAVPSALAADALAAPAAKPEINYKAPDGVPLDAVNELMAITCHASPDAGFPQLKQFFSGTQSTMTVGMYDFTSKHVLDALTESLSGKQSVTLTLDHPAPNPTADQTDEQTVANLEAALGKRFKQVWALVKSSPKAPKWIYPSAYHIKVAVRDSSAFWLSSGNWNNSNQPDIDPVKDPAGSGSTARKSDRDWHVIVEHKGLAETFEAYVRNDFRVAQQAESGVVVAANEPTAIETLATAGVRRDTAYADLAGGATVEAGTFKKYFSPVRIPAAGTRKIQVQPLLTPDNYVDHVLPLIQQARKTLYMQTQYIHPSDAPADQPLADLVSAVVDLQRSGLDVRVILSQWEAQGGWLEKLQSVGMDLNSVRIQNGVHNKGIVVDSKAVMLGSQNWSGQGVETNRDASLIIFDEEAARYYEAIFLHDWVNLAKQAGL